MSVRTKATISAAALVVVTIVLALFLHSHTVAVLNTRGVIADQERSLMATAVLLGMIVIIPVYILTVVIAWKYRETNTKAKNKKYSPSWDHSRWLEGIWWAIPLIIITILSVITWRSSYALDPFKALNTTAKPLTVQVVALDWKWLFIYPDQKVASINQVQIPVNRPVTFDITSDTVMNSFWVPQLGGQIYAMPGMATQLHLMTGKTGTYNGSSANISGNGFSGMNFTVKAEPESQFDSWTTSTHQSTDKLTLASYKALAKQSRNNPVTTYSLGADNLFGYIVMKYMEPGAGQ